MYCQTLSAVNHPPNCSTQQSLKVMTACKKGCAALVASSAPPIKSSCKKAMTPSSSLNTAGEACAVVLICWAMQRHMVYRLYAVYYILFQYFAFLVIGCAVDPIIPCGFLLYLSVKIAETLAIGNSDLN